MKKRESGDKMDRVVKKAIIPAAGLGTRFLPATKSMPKEMLPIVDVPSIQYIVEEAVKSGIEEILIITNPYKKCIEDHFDKTFELEERLNRSGKTKELEMIHKISEMADLFFVRQKEPKGLGHAILCTKAFVGNEPFAVMLGDDVVVNREEEPAMKQLIRQYELTGSSILGVQEVPLEETGKYGIVKTSDKVGEGLYALEDMVEKPKENPPGNLAVMGRYILSPAIFEHLKEQKPGALGEIQLTDAIASLMREEKVYAYQFTGKRYDIGDKIGYLKAILDFALERESLRQPLLDYIYELAEKNKE